jgi:tungstate transport system substrate-binding protein
MQEGNGTSRRLVMYNDFIIVGPPDDPAHIRGVAAAEALQKIATHHALFISRGDQSGTHVRELSVWQRLGLNPKGQPWYRETGQGQALTMDVASHQRAYALTDRGTFLAHAKRLDVVVLVEHDPWLLNIYHVMPVNPHKFPKVNAQAAQAFADFLVSEEGQRLIGDFGTAQYGQSLFTPAAHQSEAELLRE